MKAVISKILLAPLSAACSLALAQGPDTYIYAHGFELPSGVLLGTISAAPNMVIDSDTNDPDRPATNNGVFNGAQLVPVVPATMVGFVTAQATFQSGDRFQFNSDRWDLYKLRLRQGQVVSLGISDFQPSNPSAVDLDLYLYTENTDGNPVAGSQSLNQVEQITIAQDGVYFVGAYANAGRSLYTITVGNSQVAQQKVLPSLTLHDAVPAQLVLAELPAGKHQAQMKRMGAKQLSRGGRVSLWDVSAAVAGKRTAEKALEPPGHPRLFAKDNDTQHYTNEIAKELMAEGLVLSAEPNYRVEPLATPNDLFYSRQWHYPVIGLPSAWDVTTGSSSVVVSIIDTGVAPHTDLMPNLDYTLGFDFIRDPARSNDGNGLDANADDPGDGANGAPSSFHGTHVAGTVGAASNNMTGVAGVAWRARLMPVRVLGIGGGTISDIVEGMYWSARLPNASGSLPAVKADILNMSLGGTGPCTFAYSLAVADARAAGSIVVAAAGNDGNGVPVGRPANCPGVVGVGATDFNSLAPYSQTGPEIDVVAPGGNLGEDAAFDGFSDGVYSTVFSDSPPPRRQNYGFYQGTSMASPHVAGVIALMKSVYPQLAPGQFDSLLAQGRLTTDWPTPDGPTVRNNFDGYGEINATKAVQVAAELAGITTQPALTVNPGFLEFGEQLTTVDFSLTNSGGGALNVTRVSESLPWVSLNSVSVNGSFEGTYRATIDRSQLFPGRYVGDIVIESNGGNTTLQIGIDVGETAFTTQLGRIFGFFIDEDGNFGAGALDSESDNYPYFVSQIEAGHYRILAGTDLDNDGFACDAGEICGAYPNRSLPSAVFVRDGGRVEGVDFQVSADFSGFGAAATVSAVEKLKQEGLPHRGRGTEMNVQLVGPGTQR